MTWTRTTSQHLTRAYTFFELKCQKQYDVCRTGYSPALPMSFIPFSTVNQPPCWLSPPFLTAFTPDVLLDAARLI